MKEYRMRSIVIALAIGTAAAFITTASGCSSEQNPEYHLEYRGASICKFDTSEEASADFAKQEARIEQLEAERNAPRLYCLGKALEDSKYRRQAKEFLSHAYSVASRILRASEKRRSEERSLTKEEKEAMQEAWDIYFSAVNALGYILQQEGNYEAAFSWLVDPARRGRPSAQNNLANLYLFGLGIETYLSQGSREAGRWFFRSAEQGHYPAQYNLAYVYDFLGNKSEALKWALLAQHHVKQKLDSEFSTRQDQDKSEEIEIFVKDLRENMGDNEKSEANSLKNEWLGQGKKIWIGAGSGFYVNERGHILTNEHVINPEIRNVKQKCDHVSVMSPTDVFPHFVDSPDDSPNKIDASLDLALLYDPKHKEREVPGSGLLYAKLRNQKSPLAPGEYVIVTGFPLSSSLALEMHTTTGVVVASSAEASDRRNFIISAPVQSGNSGGPVLDANGNVIGVVVRKEDLRGRGSGRPIEVIQNINFAVSLEQVREFLEKALKKDEDATDKETTLSPPIDSNSLSVAPIIDSSGRQVVPMVSKQAQGYTVLVECWMSAKD